jgi:hypothetical protein
VRTAARAATPAEEFGFLGGGFRSGQPASSELTRQMMGWEPTHVGLIEDIEQGHYADLEALKGSERRPFRIAGCREAAVQQPA